MNKMNKATMLAAAAVARRKTAPPPASGYAAEVLADSPVAYWRLGESSGTTSVDETGTNNAVYISAPTLAQIGAKSGNTAVLFTAAQSEHTIDTTFSGISGYPFTLEAWVKFTSAAEVGIISLGQGGLDNRYFCVTANAGKLRIVARNTAYTHGETTGAYNDGNWHHIVAVFASATDRKLYVDGNATPAASDTTSVTYGATGEAMVGIFRNTGASKGFFDGTIDEAAVYPSALSTARIAVHYSAS